MPDAARAPSRSKVSGVAGSAVTTASIRALAVPMSQAVGSESGAQTVMLEIPPRFSAPARTPAAR